MIKMLTNQKELKQIYTLISNPSSSLEYAHNLGFELGKSTHNSDFFTLYFHKLITKGILTIQYDFYSNNGTREAIYTFKDGSEIEFFGKNHMI